MSETRPTYDPHVLPVGTICQFCGHAATEQEPVVRVPPRCVCGDSVPTGAFCADELACFERYAQAPDAEPAPDCEAQS